MKKIFFILFVACFIAPQLYADDSYRSKLGIDIRGVKPNLQGAIGWVAGARAGHYLGTSNAYFGIEGAFGAPQGGNPRDERMWYAGILVGYDGRLSRLFTWELGVLGGLGAGKSPALDEQSFYTVEPSLGLGFALGGGYKLTIAFSYLHMTDAPRFSGMTFGIRIDRKTQTTIKDIND